MKLIPKEIEAILPPLYSRENVADPVARHQVLRPVRQLQLLRFAMHRPQAALLTRHANVYTPGVPDVKMGIPE